MSTEIQIHRPADAISLPDKGEWTNRMEIKSSSSDRIYVISQNKKTKKWGCSCPSYRVRRYCKHLLDGCGLSTSQIHGHDQFEEKSFKRIGNA